MNTVGPAMSLRTSCWLLPQNEQYNVFLESPLEDLLMDIPLSPLGRPMRTQIRTPSNTGPRASL
jgi:hypothetical protein